MRHFIERWEALAWVGGCLVLGCGGTVSPAGGDASVDSAIPVDGGVADACVTADGIYAVCNGTHGCFPPDKQTRGSVCESCFSFDVDQVGMCESAKVGVGRVPAFDGEVYIAESTLAPDAWTAFPYEVGVLFANNGGASRVRYADWKPWTGAPLPEPSNCPTFPGFRICGGNCGGCKVDEWCIGRSPDHPWGICVPTWSATAACVVQDGGVSPCPSGASCFVLKSSPDGQPLANHGFCMDAAGCQAAQSNYPGGALCDATP